MKALQPILACALLIVCYAFWSAEAIDLFFNGVDLGRHLKNGEELLSGTTKILHTNFYSYTAPDFPFVNHHWLAGVVFYLIWKLAGFAGLNAFYILLGAISLLIAWRMAQKAAGWAIPTALALAILPILRARASVRPEIFTILFCSLFLWILWDRQDWRSLLVLPALEVLWVNLHIGFIFGPVFIGAFLLGAFLERSDSLKRLLGILSLTVAATLANPNGIHGAIYPFTIWSNYGLEMIENRSISFLEDNGFAGEFFIIKLTIVLLALSFLVKPRGRATSFALLSLAVLMSGMTWFAIRNQTLLAMFALPAIALNAGDLSARWRRTTLVAGLAIAAGAGYNGYRLLSRTEQTGLGLKAGSSGPAEFLRSSQLQGPMLNNLNTGGYIELYLFSQYRVYVDSRPEAFPATFMQQKYEEPLKDEARWKQLLDNYHFNMICFSGSTAWENRFVTRRAKDPEWAVVYAQDPVIIMARRTEANRGIIQQYEVPKERLFK